MRALMSKNVSSTCALGAPRLAQQLVVDRGRACPGRPRSPPAARRSRAGAAAGRASRIPRAIAPLVTMTTSSPAGVPGGDRRAHAVEHVARAPRRLVGDDARAELEHDRRHGGPELRRSRARQRTRPVQRRPEKDSHHARAPVEQCCAWSQHGAQSMQPAKAVRRVLHLLKRTSRPQGVGEGRRRGRQSGAPGSSSNTIAGDLDLVAGLEALRPASARITPIPRSRPSR